MDSTGYEKENLPCYLNLIDRLELKDKLSYENLLLFAKDMIEKQKLSIVVYGIQEENDKKLFDAWQSYTSDNGKIILGILSNKDSLILSDKRLVGECSHILSDNYEFTSEKMKTVMDIMEVKEVEIREYGDSDDAYLLINKKALFKLNKSDNKMYILRLVKSLIDALQLKEILFHGSAFGITEHYHLIRVLTSEMLEITDEADIPGYFLSLLNEYGKKEMTRELFDFIRVVEYETGYIYYFAMGTKKDKKEALKWLKRAARKNHPGAQNMLGYCCYYGIGTEKDQLQAVRLYTAAARQGDNLAQNNLGLCLLNGLADGKPDPKGAFEWFRHSAQQGHPMGQNNLAGCYFYGKGVDKNMQYAFRWYTKASYNGCHMAQYNLANMIFWGNGVEKNIEEARKWYEKSAQSGYIKAKEALDSLNEAEHKGKIKNGD
jgi:hypothetical protein